MPDAAVEVGCGRGAGRRRRVKRGLFEDGENQHGPARPWQSWKPRKDIGFELECHMEGSVCLSIYRARRAYHGLAWAYHYGGKEGTIEAEKLPRRS